MVWYNPQTNDVDVWLMHDGNWKASDSIGEHAPGSVAVGVGDFDHNGVDDIVWQNTSNGHIETWMLS